MAVDKPHIKERRKLHCWLGYAVESTPLSWSTSSPMGLGVEQSRKSSGALGNRGGAEVHFMTYMTRYDRCAENISLGSCFN